MSFLAPEDTLAYQIKARPFTTKLSFANSSCAQYGESLEQYVVQHAATGSDKDRHPEDEALSFYLLNHAVSQIRLMFSEYEPLPAWALDVLHAYHDFAHKAALRALHYTIIISCREARHCHGKPETITHLKNLGVPDAAADILFNVDGSTALTNWVDWFKQRGETKLSDVLWGLKEGFNLNKYGGAFGGKPWGSIADCAYQYTLGNYSGEMFLDMVWTLSHNNGPIFNKGFLYHMYDGYSLKMILDVQRSGQIPQLVKNPKGKTQNTEESLACSSFCARVRDDLGWLYNSLPFDDFTTDDWVDFAKVKQLGGIGNYDKYIPADAMPQPKAPMFKTPAGKTYAAAKKYSPETHFVILPKEGFAFKKLPSPRAKKEVA